MEGKVFNPRLNGRAHGTQIVYDNSGNVVRTSQWVNGKESGTRFTYTDNKIFTMSSIVNDARHGIAAVFHPTGALATVSFYKDNRSFGLRAIYDENTHNITSFSMMHSDLTEVVRWGADGEIIHLYNVFNGTTHGHYIYCNPDQGISHGFLSEGNIITDEIVGKYGKWEDFTNQTRVMIKLEYGINVYSPDTLPVQNDKFNESMDFIKSQGHKSIAQDQIDFFQNKC